MYTSDFMPVIYRRELVYNCENMCMIDKYIMKSIQLCFLRENATPGPT